MIRFAAYTPNMWRQYIIFLTIFLVKKCAVATEQSINNTQECLVTSIDADLNMAMQNIQNAKQKLPADLKEFCRKSPYGAKPLDCSDLYRSGYRTDGTYLIWPQSRMSNGPLRVYCDMTGQGGGWTVIQRRGDFNSSKDYFFKNWNEYKNGFGDITKDFWMGNDAIFALTNQKIYQIRFDLRDWEQNYTYATYDEFWIGDESQNYIVHVKGYRGTAGDNFSENHDGSKFSTKDKDNDSNEGGSCALHHKGGWWYGYCHASNLNGLYLKGPHESYADGVNWRDFKGYHYSLKDTVMKIRPADFGININV